MSSGPSAPDPYQTANAQAQASQQTANYNAALNRVSEYTPYGNLIYSQTGKDSSGAPTWRADVSLTPDAQQQLDNQLKQNNMLSQLGFTLADQAKGQINSPWSDQSQSAKDAADAYYANQKQYLDPQWQQSDSNLASRLANQGIMQGSEAYNRANTNQNLARQQAYQTAQNNALQQGQSQQAIALQNQAAIKNSALNQLNALRYGTQIQNPTFSAVPGANAQSPDVEGDIYKSYQLNSANSNNFLNGLFGLGSAAIMASDRRLKRDIKRIGETGMGLPLYEYRYLWDDRLRVGVMADEVEKVIPAAVLTMPSGFKAVNYGMLA